MALAVSGFPKLGEPDGGFSMTMTNFLPSKQNVPNKQQQVYQVRTVPWQVKIRKVIYNAHLVP
jgi:hypothetical protein